MIMSKPGRQELEAGGHIIATVKQQTVTHPCLLAGSQLHSPLDSEQDSPAYKMFPPAVQMSLPIAFHMIKIVSPRQAQMPILLPGDSGLCQVDD